ncbi:hypothetical protein HY041_02840 [Candidatus Roizmanbacteria bacterium]|nr:hypothetical protein [Candidatus Roizmanbacteria bacterium]
MYYKKIVSSTEYFENKKVALYLAPVILYPILFNYILLNQSFQYYDFTSILIFTAGLYFIIKENYTALLITFMLGLVNKESIVYLIFSYTLFNYKSIFTKKIVLRTALLCIIFVVYKLILGYIFRSNTGDTFEIGYDVNVHVFKNFFNNRVYQKDILLNFGGLYIFVLLLFVTGRFRKFPYPKKVYIHLTFIPYILLGVFLIYFSEVRVYIELIPMVTTLFMIYLSTFPKLWLKPKESVE